MADVTDERLIQRELQKANHEPITITTFKK